MTEERPWPPPLDPLLQLGDLQRSGWKISHHRFSVSTGIYIVIFCKILRDHLQFIYKLNCPTLLCWHFTKLSLNLLTIDLLISWGTWTSYVSHLECLSLLVLASYHCLKKRMRLVLPCWLPRGWQVSHSTMRSDESITCTLWITQVRGSALAFKSSIDITRSTTPQKMNVLQFLETFLDVSRKNVTFYQNFKNLQIYHLISF